MISTYVFCLFLQTVCLLVFPTCNIINSPSQTSFETFWSPLLVTQQAHGISSPTPDFKVFYAG